MCIQIRQVVSVQNKAFTFAGNNAIILSINTFFASHVQHRPAEKKKKKKSNCLWQPCVIHLDMIFLCITNTWWQRCIMGFLWNHYSLQSQRFVFASVCVHARLRFLEPVVFLVSQEYRPPQTDTDTDCLCKAHTSASTCVFMCVCI